MKILISLFLLFASISIGAQNDSTTKSYREDFNTFIQLLEETHPDPYTAFGGIIEFRRKVQSVRENIRFINNVEEFNQQLSEFISQLEDGHTFMYALQNNRINNLPNKYFPIIFNVAADGLFVQRTDNEQTLHNGKKLLAINTIPIDSLLRQIKTIEPVENNYGALLSLRNKIANQRYISTLLDDTSSVKLTLQDKNGNIEDIKVSYNENPKWNKINSLLQIKKDNNLLYGQILKDSNVAYFAFNGIISREVVESIEMTAPQYQNLLTWALNLTGAKNLKTNKETVGQIPELYETFAKLLQQMKKQKSEYLIIDLRKNTGGMTPLTLPLLYMLYGDKYLNFKSNMQYIQRLSPLLLQKWNMRNIDEYNKLKNTNYVLGDYIYSKFFNTQEQTIAEKRKNLSLISYNNGIGKEFTQDLNGKPIYEPHVIVLCSPQTFSAAYHFMYYLTEIGSATVVGVPSSQAGNAFMETTPFELPNTKLKGSISNAVQIMFPDDNTKGKVFLPDFLMNWKDFQKYDFDENAEILYCIDLIKQGKIK